jgi:hypothetical protein
MEVYPKCCVHFDDWTGVDAMQTHRDAGSFKPIVVRKGCYRDQIVPLPIDLSMPLRDLAAWSQAISSAADAIQRTRLRRLVTGRAAIPSCRVPPTP